MYKTTDNQNLVLEVRVLIVKKIMLSKYGPYRMLYPS